MGVRVRGGGGGGKQHAAQPPESSRCDDPAPVSQSAVRVQHLLLLERLQRDFNSGTETTC